MKRGPAKLQQLLPPSKHPERDVLSLPSLEVLSGLVDVLWRSIFGAIDQDMDRLINVESDFGRCEENTDSVDQPKNL